MTIPATIRRSEVYAPDGEQTTFPFTFKVFPEGGAAPVLFDDNGNEVPLVLDSDYTITVNEDQENNPGGEIVFGDAPEGSALVILGNVSFEQPVALPAGGSYRAPTVEGALDRLSVLTQQLQEEVSRSILFSPAAADDDFDATLPPPAEGVVLGWDVNASRLVNVAREDFIQFAAAVQWKVEEFIGDGEQTTWELSETPGALNNMVIWIDGAIQRPGVDYTYSHGVFFETSDPVPNGERMIVRYGEVLNTEDLAQTEANRIASEAAKEAAESAASAASTSASNAATSASNAATSESNASGSAAFALVQADRAEEEADRAEDFANSISISTQAEAEQGAENESLMTPLRTRQAITYVAEGQSGAPRIKTAALEHDVLSPWEMSNGAAWRDDRVRTRDANNNYFLVSRVFATAPGEYTVSWQQRLRSSGNSMQTQIRVNGSVVHTAATTSSQSYVTQSTIITVSYGDRIEWWNRSTGGSTPRSMRRLRISSQALFAQFIQNSDHEQRIAAMFGWELNEQHSIDDNGWF